MTELSPTGKRWTRRGAWAIAGVLFLWAMGWLAVPPLLKSQIERLGSDRLGRKVTVGAVEFRPWSLELTLNELRVATADGSAAQWSAKRLYLDAELQSLLRMAPVIDALTLDAPRLHLTRVGPGRYDIDDILQKLAAPADAPASAPPQFALHNLRVNDGALDFTDAGHTHTLRELQLSLPSLSNFEARREQASEAKLSFKLGGAGFDAAAQTTPFARAPRTDATLKVTTLDLAPYLAYLPAQLPLQPQAATLDMELKIAFQQSPQNALTLSGTVQASRVRLTDAKQQKLLDFDSLKLVLDDVQPLLHKARLSSVEWSGPHLNALRDRNGRLNLSSALAGAAAEKSAPAKTAAGATPTAWQVSVARFSLRGGSVDWSDASTARGKTGAAQLRLSEIGLEATGIALPWTQPMAFNGKAALVAGRPTAAPPATLQFDGTATDSAAKVTARVGSLPLSVAAPYLAQYLEPTLGGTLDAELDLDWQDGSASNPLGVLKLALPRLALSKLDLTQAGNTLAAVQSMQASDGQIDLNARTASLGKLGLSRVKVALERDADKHWMFEKWLKSPVAGADQAAPRGGGAAGAARPWKLAVAELLLADSDITWLDHATAKPVQLDVSRLRVQVKPLVLNSKAPAALQVQAAVRSGHSEPGQLMYRGRFSQNPLSVQGSVDLRRFPVQALEPYFADALNVELLRADTSFKGQVSYADSSTGMRLHVSGDAAVEEFRANTIAGVTPGTAPGSAASQPVSEELLSWKVLNVRALELAMAPPQASVLSVGETTLADFYARVVIRENGRINLQDLVKAAPATAAATASDDQAGAAAPVLNFGPTSLLAGKVLFSDYFIRPNYSADLSELTGRLGAFSSVAPGGDPQMAALELRGRVQGTAALEIVGQVNPLAQPLALDIKASARDLELPPLSAYSVRYAGHGIERGKLSMDVGYKVLPDGQLSASNKLVLNQLAFGDKAENAPASLPVKLAVALLADRNGVIDIDLPISGSINDPQFSIGPLIFKVIVNLIGKAITAPFSLLAKAFGGNADEQSAIHFAAGSAALTPQARQSLDKVAQALNDRPALKMTVIGAANLEAERAPYQRERLGAMVLAEKRRALLTRSGLVAADGADAAGVQVNASEYPVLLKEVYRRASIPKPRNLIGLAKDIAQGEMEALLLANIAVTDELMHELAVQRGVAVKDYLASQQLPLERLFLGAVRTTGFDAKWTPSAQLQLDAR